MTRALLLSTILLATAAPAFADQAPMPIRGVTVHVGPAQRYRAPEAAHVERPPFEAPPAATPSAAPRRR